MEEKLRYRLKEQCSSIMHGMALLVLIAVFLFAGSLLSYLEIINIVKMERHGWLILCFNGLFLIGSLLGSFIACVPYILDFQSIKKKTYKIINVVVLHFDFYQDGIEPPNTHCIPVFKDLQTGEIFKIVLDRDVESGECYTLCLLPRTKVTVVVKKIRCDSICSK